MNFDKLSYSVHDIRRLGDILVLDTSPYEQLKVHINRAYQDSPRRRADCMEQTVMLMEQQPRAERQTLSTGVGSSPQSVVHQGSYICMEKGDGLVQLIWTVRFDDVIRSAASV